MLHHTLRPSSRAITSTLASGQRLLHSAGRVAGDFGNVAGDTGQGTIGHCGVRADPGVESGFLRPGVCRAPRRVGRFFVGHLVAEDRSETGGHLGHGQRFRPSSAKDVRMSVRVAHGRLAPCVSEASAQDQVEDDQQRDRAEPHGGGDTRPPF